MNAMTEKEKKRNQAGLSLIAAAVCGVLILLTDQLTKRYIVAHFQLGESAPFLKGVVELSYIHNSGGAWGLLSGKPHILMPMTLLIMALCIFLLRKVFRKSKLLLWAIMLVLSGGTGNLIDRIFRNGKVVDFLHFEFFPSFPVFNVADCAIVAGAGLLILFFLLDSRTSLPKAEGTDAGD